LDITLQWRSSSSDDKPPSTSIGGGTLVPRDAAASPQISKSTPIFSYFMHYEPP